MSISLRCTGLLLTAFVVAGCDRDVDRATAPSSPRDVHSALASSAAATPAAYVRSGGSHACALRTEGTITCWGNDLQYWSQPGFGGSPQPTGVFTQLDAHGRSACAVSTAGQIACWGVAGWGQNNAPAPPAGLTFRQASIGALTACGLLSNGAITCWGDYRNNLLSPPTGVFTDVAVGYTHACAVRDDGTLACWGIGSMSNAPAPPANRRFVQVAAGNLHSCVLADDGAVQCWGDNSQGALNVPALPAGVTYTQVSVSNEARADPSYGMVSCALRSDGAAVCWGSSGLGQLGVPALPADVVYTSVSASHWNACASRSDGAVLCWGIATTELNNVPATLNLLKKTQPIVFTPAVPNSAVPASTFELVPNAGSGNPVTLNALTPSVCTIDGTTLTFAAEGTCSFTADRAGTAEYDPAPQLVVTVNVAVGNQSIAFTSAPPSPAYYGGAYVVSANGGSSGNPVTFSSLTAATCTVDANTQYGNIVNFSGVGDCTIAADQAGNASYHAAAQVTQTVAVGRRPQTIKFTSKAPNPGYVGDTYAVSATVGSNGNIVAIAAGPAAVCTMTNGTVAFVAAGTCTVTATQDGNALYEPAPPNTQAITVMGRSQAISFSLPSTGVIGSPITVAATGGASGNPVTFTVLTPSTCALSGSTLNLTNIGQCTVAADQAGNTGYAAAPRVTATVAVRWPFTGFVGLVAPPSINGPIKAGSTVTLTFSLGGNRGTSVVVGATVGSYDCATPPAPGSGSPISGTLSYNSTTAQYSYRYNTLRTRLPNTCIQLTLPLADGTVHTALFKFK